MAGAVLTGTAELPAPIETNTTAYFHIAIGKTSSVWALLVDGIANFTMSHLHYVSRSPRYLVMPLRHCCCLPLMAVSWLPPLYVSGRHPSLCWPQEPPD